MMCGFQSMLVDLLSGQTDSILIWLLVVILEMMFREIIMTGLTMVLHLQIKQMILRPFHQVMGMVVIFALLTI